MRIIKLNMSCSASSDYLTLLPYYHNESKSDVSDQFINNLKSYNGSKFKIWEPFLENQPNFTKTDIRPELKDTKEIPMRHLLMIVNDKLAKGKDRLSVWVYAIIIMSIAVFGLVSAYFTYYYCKRRSAKRSLRLAKKSGKTKKTPVYNAVAVYSWSRDDVSLEGVTFTQLDEEVPMIPKSVKKQQVKQKKPRSALPVLKLAAPN